MKKVISIVLTLLMVLGLCTSLTACHGSKGLEAFVLPEEFDTTQEYNLVFWAKNDSNKTQVEIYEKAVSEFEKLYPNIHVSLKKYSDYNTIYNDVITNISTGTTPNICITYPDHIATYKTGTNVVVPLDELASDVKYGLGGSSLLFDGPTREEVVTEFLEECKLGGVLYALPYMRSTEALYINKTYVEQMGYSIPDIPTWDWIWEVSEAALEKQTLSTLDKNTGEADWVYKVNGQKVMIPFIYKSTDNMMISITEQLGSGYSTDEGENLLFNDATKAVLKEIAKHGKTGAFSTFKISSYPGNFLNAGQCLFAIDSTAGATWMGCEAMHQDIASDSIIEFETVVRPIPQYDVSNPKMISQGPSVCIFNKKDPQEVLASWLFAQYLLTNETQISYSQTEGYLPVTNKAFESEEYKDYLRRSGEDNELYYNVKIDAAKLLMDNVENTFVTPVFNGSVSLRNAAGALIENVVKAERRGQTVDDAFIDQQYEDLTTLYRLNQNSSETIGKTNLGPLPRDAKVLLFSLGAVWLCIAIYALIKYNKGRKKS